MKISRTLSMVLCAATLLAFTTACGDTETEWVTAPTLSASQAVVTAPDEGGSLTVVLTIANPVDGATISASPSASWVTVESCTTSFLTLSTSANPYADPRTARVTVTYSYTLAGAKSSCTCEVTVAQGYGDQPAISVQPTAVAAAIAGGTYSFDYTIVNPASDGEISTSTSATWISGISASNGSVTFTVAQNTDALRQADITLTYSWSGGSISESVVVVQDHEGGSDSESGEIDNLVGTYSAAGYAYFSEGVANYTTWTLTIYKSGSNEVIIDGLVPKAEGMYPDTEAYIARASLNSAGQLVIPTQYTGYYISSNGYHIGWTPCTSYSTSDGWYYSKSWPDCTLTYNPSTGIWTSDYGMFLALFTTTDLSTATLSGFYDVTNPGFQITKDGDLPDSPSDLSEFVGTYSCSGETCDSSTSQPIESEWTMKIYDHGDGRLLLSGLIPNTVDYYPYTDDTGKTYENGPYTAYATASGDDIDISLPQFTGWSNNNGYIVWVMSSGYTGSGWSAYYSSVTIRFTYNSSTDSWSNSAYGLMLGVNTDKNSITNSTFTGFFDAFSPGMTFKKTSGTTSTGYTKSSLMSLEDRPAHTNFEVASGSILDSQFTVHRTGFSEER